MILSFLTPYFSSVVNNISDARGGSEVSTAGQTTGVLANPVGTIVVISNFVFGSMLTPAFLNSISTNMAYLGDVSNLFPWLSYLPIVLFEAICIIDNEKVSLSKICFSAFIKASEHKFSIVLIDGCKILYFLIFKILIILHIFMRFLLWYL